MKKKIFFLFLLVFSACSEKIDIEIPTEDDKIVVNSFINPDSIIKVEISKSTSIGNCDFAFIDDAIVELWEGDDFIENLSSKDSGLYNSSIHPEVNKDYQLKIRTVDGILLACKDYVPTKIEITDAYFIFPAGYLVTDLYEGPYAEAYITFNDPVNEINHYELSLHLQNPYANDIFGGIKISSEDPNALAEGITDYEPGYVLLSDRNFNGNTYTVKLRFTSGLFWDYKFFVALLNVTPTYFKYKKSLVKQMYYQEGLQDFSDLQDFSNFIISGEPVNIHSNVVNGLGVFAAYHSTVKQMEFKQ